jgi:hypothetical protein
MVFKNAGKIIRSTASNFLDRSIARLTGSGVAKGDSRVVNALAKWSGRSHDTDWRVRLQIPAKATQVYESVFGTLGAEDNRLLDPLKESRGIFWPLTPTMVIQHSSNYNALSQTHSNYPFQAYQNSQVDSLNIIGEFPVQNSEDAKHWIATVNFLRTITKMYFGADKQLKGNPPPILHLSGYGDHMYNKVPVVVNTFNLELRAGIDYISSKQNGLGTTVSDRDLGGYDEAGVPINPESTTWAPTLSNISVLVTPVYSRESIKNFSFSDFARGKLQGNDRIGFI